MVQMEPLTALCDTFLPSIDGYDTGHVDESVAAFLRISASMTGTPGQVEELLTKKLQHPKLLILRVAICLLSTWPGTFILCGKASLSRKFPYFQKFSKVSPHKREQIVQSWSESHIYLLRMLFLGVKYLTMLAFFTQVNDKKENPSWKAIGYPGPDPDIKSQIQKNETISNLHDEENTLGPLCKGLLDLSKPKKVVFEFLKQKGFMATIPESKNIKTSTKEEDTMTIKCDAVVVGSGSGGGVVAGVLAKAGFKVIVLEKGKYHDKSNLSLLEGEAMDEMYLGNGLLATDDMGAVILAGSTVGGGSAINWSACIRTPEHVLKEWCEEYEVELFGSKLYQEALEIVCEKMGVQSEINNEGFNNVVLRKGCKELGYPVNTVPRNAPEDHYCGWCCFGCKDGRKQGMSYDDENLYTGLPFCNCFATTETWLVDLVKSGNGLIIPCSSATKVLHSQKKGQNRKTAVGVAFEFQHKDVKQLCTIESKVTVVACGALCTPPLLKISGLKNPNIGKNLHIHPVTMAWGYFPEKNWPEEEKKSYEGGIVTAISPVVPKLDKSGYGAILQTPSLHPGNFAALMPWVSGERVKKQMCKFSRIANIFALARDKGSGEVSSPSSISYHLARHDENSIQTGLEKALRILAAAGAEEIGTHHGEGRILNVKQASESELEEFVKEESQRRLKGLRTPICSAHQMGSCRMGVKEKTSAVNQMGETWEVEDLYVADTSVFPTALGVNPMVTVQAISYCTAQSVLDSLRKK